MAGGAGTWRGTGGMATKLNAAQLCLEAGVDMVIANGARMEALYDIVEGRTWAPAFLPGGRAAIERRRNPMTVLETQGLAARHAARALAVAGTARKNAALEAAARAIEARQEILAANAADLEAARAAGLRPALLDRLALDEGRIAGIVEGAAGGRPPDPIGAVTKMDTRPNGLTIGKRRVPLGVIGIIYEARPNVTVGAAALCLKSGNAALLRAARRPSTPTRPLWPSCGTPWRRPACPGLRGPGGRYQPGERQRADGPDGVPGRAHPRGGAGLIRSVVENARVPVIQTGVGCATSTSTRADLDMAARILHNAKTSRPSVCNAAECVLVDRAAARDFLPLAWELLQTKGVELRGCRKPGPSWGLGQARR